MTTTNDTSRSSGMNGRKAAFIIIAVAFAASLTTLILALTASQRARERDAVGLVADTADLREAVAGWTAAVRGGPEDLSALEARRAALGTWKPRTPCGREARDGLDAAMETRLLLLRGTSTTTPDENAVLESTLRRCQAERGRDVNL